MPSVSSSETVRSFLATEEARDLLVEIAAQCSTCMARAYGDLAHYNELVAARVSAAISAVSVAPFFVHA